jgi:hypothetical protein
MSTFYDDNVLCERDVKRFRARRVHRRGPHCVVDWYRNEETIDESTDEVKTKTGH